MPYFDSQSYPLMNWRWKLAQKAEFRWWKNYLQKKDPEDYLRKKTSYWKRVLATAEYPLRPGERVLDAGCGPAGIFMALNDQQVDAVDPLLDRYEKGLNIFHRAHYPYVNFFAENLETFHPKAPYPVVFCLNAINHVRDIEMCVDALAMAVAPGGTLILSVDAHRYTWCKALFRAIPGDILHPQQDDAPGYECLLYRKGFELCRRVILKEELIFRHYLYVFQNNIRQ